MERQSLAKRYALFILGLYFLAAGVVLIIRSSLGTTPISSMNYVLSINTPLSLGTCTFAVNMIMILMQYLIIYGRGTRKDAIEIFLQIPLSFVFSLFIDFNMYLTQGLVAGNYFTSLVFLACGCILQSIGVVLEIKPKVAMMSAEGLVKYLSMRSNREFGKVKVWVDVSLVLMAVALSLFFTRTIEGVREGSVIAACATGYIVTFLNKRVMTRKTLYKILPVLAR